MVQIILVVENKKRRGNKIFEKLEKSLEELIILNLTFLGWLKKWKKIGNY